LQNLFTGARQFRAWHWQLPVSALQALIAEFFYHARYDAQRDLLIDTSPAPTSMGSPRAQWVNPDPAIAKAQAAYYAAVEAARPPQVMPAHAPTSPPKSRPGWAS